MADEPGPFAVREPMPLPPRVITPGRVTSLGAELSWFYRGTDDQFGAFSAALARDGSAAYAGDDGGALGDAVAGADATVPGGANDALAAAVDNGVAIDDDGSIQQSVLPGPDQNYPADGTDAPLEHEPPPHGGDEPPRGPGGGGPGGGGGGPGGPGGPTDEEKHRERVRSQVRQIYRDLLQREADPGGLENYVDRVIIDGFTLDQVRDAIRQSDEYHEKHPFGPPP